MRPLKEKSAKEVAQFIYEDLICRWGCSEYHITDQGREFVNLTNKELLDLCGTKQQITSAYHPQANGLSEHMNRSTQESLRKSLRNEHEFDWVDMIPTIAFSHRSSMNASTRVSPLEMILGHKPNVPIDIHKKYPTEEDLDRDLTTEEVARLEREYLDMTIEEMKKVKETMIGRAKVNIANSQIRQKRNYDKRFESKENFEIGDLVLLENQVNRNRKGGKREKRFSGPDTILDISKAANCTLKHKEGAVKKTKHPLAHLKQYHKRNLVVESENEIEENREDRTEVDHILESFEKEGSLEFVESLETEENIEEKLQKKGNMDGNWNFAENVMGLVHLKQYHKRNLVVESENEIEENREDRTEVDHILESFEKEGSLEFVESLEAEENIEEKLQKKGKMDGNWNFAENVMGLVHLKQYHKRNLVVESENEIEENREDRTEVDHILESFEKEGSLEFVESLETEENIEEKLQKKGKMDGNWNFAENVMGLVHLKQYHKRNLVVESENEIEENREDRTEVDHILESFEKEGSLEFVESLETEENIEEKLQKKGNMDGNWNFAENVMGLVIKDKFKCKRKQNDSTVKKRKVTYVTVLSLLEMHSGRNVRRPRCRPFSLGILGASDLILLYYWGRLRSAAPTGGGPCSTVLRHLRAANALVRI